MRILAIDIGSSAIKAALHGGKTFARAVRLPFATTFENEKAEVDPQVLLKTFFRTARSALAQGKKSPDAIAFCTFSPGVLLTDNVGRPASPIITHADRRSSKTAQQLVAEHGKPFWLSHAGNLPYAGSIGASTLAFLRKNSPHLFPKNYRIAQASTLIAHALTGQFTIDPSQAVFLGLYDIRRGSWNDDLCDAVGIHPASLPAIRPADCVLGTLSKTAAARLGLPGGIPIVGGFVDTSAAILQTPMTPGQLTHSAGSTDVLALCVGKPRPAEGILTRPVGVGAAEFPNRWLAVRTIASAGSALSWARETLFCDLSAAALQKLLDQTCKNCHGGGAPSLPVCIPTFAGERAAILQPPGAAFSNLHLSTSREDILQALVAALAQQSADNYRLLEKIHAPAKVVYAMGGASSLASAMHAAWPRRKPGHVFRSLASDNLAGLILLARKTLNP